MEIPIKCKYCNEIIFIPYELKGLEDELKFNICDNCEDQDEENDN